MTSFALKWCDPEGKLVCGDLKVNLQWSCLVLKNLFTDENRKFIVNYAEFDLKLWGQLYKSLVNFNYN